MFKTLLINLLCVFLMMVPGYIAIKKNLIKSHSIKDMSVILIKFLYPCLIFSSITANFRVKDLIDCWILPVVSFLIMLIGYLIGLAVTSTSKIHDHGKKTAFLFQSTMNNYSFLPIALAIAIFGENGVALLVISTLGAELAMWTLGMFILNGHQFQKENLKHLCSPPLIGLYLAILCIVMFHLFGVEKEQIISGTGILHFAHATLSAIGKGTIPIAMIIAGARLSSITPEDLTNRLVWRLSIVRLVVIPLAAIIVLKLIPMPEYYFKIMAIVAVMPVSINSLMLSELYGGDKPLINGSVLLTHLLTIVTVPITLSIFI